MLRCDADSLFHMKLSVSTDSGLVFSLCFFLALSFVLV